MDSGGPMGRDDSGFFADANRRAAYQTAIFKDDKIASLEDTIADLKRRLADQSVEIDRLTAKYKEEHFLRTKKRSWLDWIMGYIG
jgi:hypothetical protein